MMDHQTKIETGECTGEAGKCSISDPAGSLMTITNASLARAARLRALSATPLATPTFKVRREPSVSETYQA